MKRLLSWGMCLGLSTAVTAATAGEPGNRITGSSVVPTTPNAAMPFVDLNGLSNLAAAPAPGITAASADLPVVPTVPATYPTTLDAPSVSYPVIEMTPTVGPTVGPTVACSAGAACVSAPRGAHCPKARAWFGYKPGPSMVPLFMTNVNHAPLMSYFPCVPGSAGGRCGSGGSGIGAAVTPSSPSAHWMQGVRAAPVPLVGSPASLDTIPAAPPTPFVDPNIDPKKLEDDKKDDEKKKDDKKSGGNRELRTTPPTPTPMVRPVSLPAQQPTPLPQGVSLPAAYPTMPTLTTPTGPRVLETPTNSTTGSRSPSRGGILDRAFSIFKSSPPPVPVAAPDAWTYPMLQQTGGSEPTVTKTIARGAAPTEPTAPTASESGIQQATHREPVRHFARPGSCPAGCADGSGNCYLGIGIPSEKYPPCMGHGNLDGYRFVKAVVHPCPPSGPLAVNACYGMRPPGCPESPIQALVDHFFPGNRRPGCAPTGVIVTNAEPIVGPSVYPPFPEHTPMTLPPVEVHAPAMR